MKNTFYLQYKHSGTFATRKYEEQSYLKGTESNHGIKFFRRLAIFNPGLAIIGFPGTGAWLLVQIIMLNKLKATGYPFVTEFNLLSYF